MNRSTYSILFSVMTLLTACATPDTTSEPITPTPNPYLRSLDIAEGGWQQLKADNGDDYRFVVSAGSVFGPSYETTLTVQDDEVVQRDLSIVDISDTGETTVTERWSETGAALGTHDEGAEPITVDARYATCKSQVDDTNLAENDVDLQFTAPTNIPEATFVLSLCLILPKDIVYDGGADVLTELEFLN